VLVYAYPEVMIMLIHEVSKRTGLTKKAIEYYSAKGLVQPSILDNGYREYSEEDVLILDKVSVLRKLDVGIEHIREILEDTSGSAIQNVVLKKELDIQRDQVKKELLAKLGSNTPESNIKDALQAIEQGKTIGDRLLEAFPGYYGRFICLHFARFLNEPMVTHDQQMAYDKILTFLDEMPPLVIPEELGAYMTENNRDISVDQISAIIEDTQSAIEHPDRFFSENKDFVERYLAYTSSDEYKESPTYKLMTLMKEFNSANGYYDVFIPAMKQLSASYARYYQQIENVKDMLDI